MNLKHKSLTTACGATEIEPYKNRFISPPQDAFLSPSKVLYKSTVSSMLYDFDFVELTENAGELGLLSSALLLKTDLRDFFDFDSNDVDVNRV